MGQGASNTLGQIQHAPDGIFVTARMYWKPRGASYWRKKYPGSRWRLMMIWVGSGGTRRCPRPLWVERCICLRGVDNNKDASESDIALLRAGMLKDGWPFIMPTVRLSLALPQVGPKKIAGLGYPKKAVESDTATPRRNYEKSH